HRAQSPRVPDPGGACGRRRAMTAPATSTCDWLQDRRVSWAWPAAFILVAVSWLVIPDPAGALLAATGFGVAGGLCVGNARHCSRTHCLITGPLYLLGAMLFLARLVGVDVPSGLVVGAAVVGTIPPFVPEGGGTREPAWGAWPRPVCFSPRGPGVAGFPPPSTAAAPAARATPV